MGVLPNRALRLVPACAALLLATSADAGTSLRRDDRLAAAEKMLAGQLKCTAPIRPAKLIRTLVARGALRNTGHTIDGSPRFEPPAALRFGPFRIMYVSGWEEGPEGDGVRPFTRGPGTAPPTFLSVTVRGKQHAVEQYLRASGSAASIGEPLWPRAGTVTIQCFQPR